MTGAECGEGKRVRVEARKSFAPWLWDALVIPLVRHPPFLRHPREGGDPSRNAAPGWEQETGPAFAGMTK